MCGGNVLWIPKRGLHFEGLKALLYSELASKPAPKYLIVHVGANDIRDINIKDFDNLLAKDFDEIAQFLPDTILVWSDMLTRLKWGENVGLAEIKALEIKRKRLNRCARDKVCSWGGKFIRHVDIFHLRTDLFYTDGIHLSDRGNDIFLNVLQASIETFMLYPHVQAFPCEVF